MTDPWCWYIWIYMVTFTINIPQMLAYIPAPWILWAMKASYFYDRWRHGNLVKHVPFTISEGPWKLASCKVQSCSVPFHWQTWVWLVFFSATGIKVDPDDGLIDLWPYGTIADFAWYIGRMVWGAEEWNQTIEWQRPRSRILWFLGRIQP